MGPGLTALLVFIALIIIWAVVLKRNIVEAAILSLIILPFFGGVDQAPGLMTGAIKYVLNYEVLYASLAFIVMSFLLQHSNVLDGMLHIFTRLFGRLKGGPAYVNTAISSALGCMSGGNTPNAANGGLGAGFPPCSGLFIVLGFPTVAGFVEEGALYMALLVTGLYQVAWRLVYIHYIVRKNHIQPTLVGEQEPISTVFRKHGICMTLFLGAVIPVLLTMGPLNKALAGRSEVWEGAMDSINLLVWLPTLMICIILLLDGKNIVKRFDSWEDCIKKFIPHMSNTGGLLFFIFAVSNIITKLGLGDDVVAILDKMNLSPIVTLIVVYLLVTVVAGPLSSTATLTAVGVVGHAILVGVGFDPLMTAAALLMISSTEGASPPASGALFVACGLTECDPPKIYMPLINWFVAPIVVMGCLVATGILPVP